MKKVLKVENLKCGGCVSRITDRLLKIEGVYGVDAIPAMGTIIISYTGQEESILEAQSRLKSMGYPMEGESTTLDSVKSYASCMIGRISGPPTPQKEESNPI